MKKISILNLLFLIFANTYTFGQNVLKVEYKAIDSTQLFLHIQYPTNLIDGKSYAAMIFFFGGGWKVGSYFQFQKQADYFTSRGLITVLADYRVASRNETTPFDAVEDAKTAIRYLKLHHQILHIDSTKIIAAGGSAGGHLAAAADLTNLDSPNENLNISSRPCALVLFNPVFNNGPGEYGYDRIGERYPEISPFHNIKKGAAPTIVFFGTKDNLVSVESAQKYIDKLHQFGTKGELYLYKDQPHGFFNNGANYTETVRQADIFLEKLGYLHGKPNL